MSPDTLVVSLLWVILIAISLAILVIPVVLIAASIEWITTAARRRRRHR